MHIDRNGLAAPTPARDQYKTRLAVSRTPRASIARTISSMCGSSMGLLPIFGKASTSSELITLPGYTSVQPAFCDSNHSRATISNDEAASEPGRASLPSSVQQGRSRLLGADAQPGVPFERPRALLLDRRRMAQVFPYRRSDTSSASSVNR